MLCLAGMCDAASVGSSHACRVGQQQVGGEGCAPGTLPPALQQLCRGNLLCLLPCSLHAHVMARDKQSSHYCITQHRKKTPANLVLCQGKRKLFLFFLNPNEIMVLYGYLCHPRRMIPLRLKQRLLSANNL